MITRVKIKQILTDPLTKKSLNCFFFIKPLIVSVIQQLVIKIKLYHRAYYRGTAYDVWTMDPEAEATLAPLRAKVKEQGDLVRSLKADGAPELDVKKVTISLYFSLHNQGTSGLNSDKNTLSMLVSLVLDGILIHPGLVRQT